MNLVAEHAHLCQALGLLACAKTCRQVLTLMSYRRFVQHGCRHDDLLDLEHIAWVELAVDGLRCHHRGLPLALLRLEIAHSVPCHEPALWLPSILQASRWLRCGPSHHRIVTCLQLVLF